MKNINDLITWRNEYLAPGMSRSRVAELSILEVFDREFANLPDSPNMPFNISGLPRVVENLHHDAFEAAHKSMEPHIMSLVNACKGGNADLSTADLIEFLAERLVNVYAEDASVDFIVAAGVRAKMLRNAVRDY